MDSIKCEAFLTAVDQGSLTAAAELLDYTQSGITRMIKALEKELGFDLLVRTKKGVVLTENGKAVLPAIRDIVRSCHLAEQMGADIRGVISGSLTIGSYYSISALWMPVILKEFRELYPKVRIGMQEGGNREMSKWLNEKSVDCCFCAKPADGTSCDWLPLFNDEIVAWLPENHPMAQGGAFPIHELEKEAFISISPKHDTDQDRMLESLHIRPDIHFSTRDAFTTYNMVAAGLGISFNQRLISRKWNGAVAEVPFDPPQYVALGVAVPSLKDASPAAKKFIDCSRRMIDEEKLQ